MDEFADHVVNPALLDMTRTKIATLGGFRKLAFIPGGDPGLGGGGDPAAGGAPPPGDPGMGGPPPGDPSMGGAPPPPPSDPRIDQLVQMITQMQQQSAAGGQAGGAGGGGGLKPKIDVNVELMQIKNLLAKICDHLGIQVPVQDMVATPDKLNAMAAGGSTASPSGTGGAIGGMPGMDPMPGAGQPGPMKAGSYKANGVPFTTTGLADTANRAAAITRLRRAG